MRRIYRLFELLIVFIIISRPPMIKRLSPEVANRIAAGETISSSVNVIKELVENALDAGATVLQVKLINEGRDRIEVNDNGSGIM